MSSRKKTSPARKSKKGKPSCTRKPKAKKKPAAPAAPATPPPAPAPPRPPGRPTVYTPELGEQLCELIAAGDTIRSACEADESLPARSTIYAWLADESHPFSGLASRARRAAAFALSDESLEIADFTALDTRTVTTRSGESYDAPDHEWIQRSKLRVAVRQTLAARYYPGVFSERLQVQDVTPLSDEELERRIADKLAIPAVKALFADFLKGRR